MGSRPLMGLLVALAGCATATDRPPARLAPPAVAKPAASATRVVNPAAPPRRPPALGLTRTLMDFAADVRPLGRLPGETGAGSAAAGLAFDLRHLPIEGWVRQGARSGAGMQLSRGSAAASLGLDTGREGPGLALGIEEHLRPDVLSRARLTPKLGVDRSGAHARLDLDQAYHGLDYRVGVAARDTPGTTTESFDVQARTHVVGGLELHGYWQGRALAAGWQERARVDLALPDPGSYAAFADAIGAHCEAAPRGVDCGLDFDLHFDGFDTRISPRWRSDPLATDRATLSSALMVQLIGELQRVELGWGSAPDGGGPSVGYRIDLPLP